MVWILFIDEKGLPASASLVCATNDKFEKSSREFVFRMTFKPATHAGQPIKSVALQTVEFQP